MSANRETRHSAARSAGVILTLGLALALATLVASCVARPTVPPVATVNVVATVTALALPAAATGTALAASATQAAAAQATASAGSAAQAAAATGTAQAQAAAATGTAQAQAAAGSATASAAAASTAAARAQADAAAATALANSLASQAATATALAAANATAFARATALAAVTPTSTPVPPTSTPQVACVPAGNAFASIIGKAATAGLDIGCTTGAVFSTDQGALQEFWAKATSPDPATHLRSLIIWRGDTRAIYVIRGQDTQASQGSLSTYSDTWQEGQPETPPACAALPVPAGYQMPVRGFGRVWCDNNLAGTIGWPNRAEAAATLQMQTTQRGLLLKVTAPSAALNYLVALDFGTKRAVTSQ